MGQVRGSSSPNVTEVAVERGGILSTGCMDGGQVREWDLLGSDS